jgi:uncharacterized protein YbbC (DUF1343 family)
MLNRIYLVISLLILITIPFCRTSYNLTNGNSGVVVTGLEIFLSKYAEKYQGKIAAIVTNHSGIDYDLQNNINLIRSKKIEVAMILAPEHGLYGYQNQYDKEYYVIDDSFNTIVYNLHQLNSRTLGHLLKIVDVVIFDIQDMGMRCYTYISSLKFVIDTLSGTEIELIVLDRPNPLGFLSVNGPYLDKNFYSKHISSFPAPLFYNMTTGEAALYYNGEYNKKVKLNVIQMKRYWRDMLYNSTNLPWIPPSPNLPTYESSIIYSAVVLLEGINISVGRGTTKPFEYIGAPWIEPVSLSRSLSKLNFDNFAFRPVYFEPTFSKYKNEKCGGVQIIYTGGKFNPVEVAYMLISHLMKNYPEFRFEDYNNNYNIDYLAGTDKFRKAISEEIKFDNFKKEIDKDTLPFLKKRKKYLIYRDNYIPM